MRDSLVGKTVTVLTEGPRLARTETFAEVTFQEDQPEGSLIQVTLDCHDGTRIKASSLHLSEYTQSGRAAEPDEAV